MKRFIYCLLSLFGLLAPVCSGQAALSFRDVTLDNGLRVIFVRDTKAPVVVSQIWYRAGAADETDGKTGLAHMLEHMMFQGTETVQPGAFSKTITRNGGNDNAFTTHDHTAYYIKVASDRLDLALRLEADRMRNLVLQQKEFETENKVVQEERRSRIDTDPNARMLEKFRAEAFGDHPYGRPVIGWMADIQNHTVTDLEAWYRRFYRPDNATLVLVGDIDWNAAERLVRQYFEKVPAGRSDAAGSDAAGSDAAGSDADSIPLLSPQPVRESRRVEVRDPAAALPLWYAGYPVPSISAGEYPEDAYALDVLATLLGDGQSSRLYRKLVIEKGFATDVGVGYSFISRAPRLLTVSMIPKPKTEISLLEATFFDEIDRIVQQPIAERELAKVKNSLIADHVYAQDSAYRVAMTVGRLVSSGADWRLAMDYPERIRSVTAGMVQHVTRRYLRRKQITVGVLIPETEAGEN